MGDWPIVGQLKKWERRIAAVCVSLERQGRLDPLASNDFSRFDIAYRSGDDQKSKLVSFMTEPFEKGKKNW